METMCQYWSALVRGLVFAGDHDSGCHCFRSPVINRIVYNHEYFSGPIHVGICMWFVNKNIWKKTWSPSHIEKGETKMNLWKTHAVSARFKFGTYTWQALQSGALQSASSHSLDDEYSLSVALCIFSHRSLTGTMDVDTMLIHHYRRWPNHANTKHMDPGQCWFEVATASKTVVQT